MKVRIFLCALAALCFSACTPDDYELGENNITSADLTEGVAFTITHDSDNPNIVYLTSLMGSSYTALWEHPQGRDQGELITLKIPFAGDYEVTFGVETRAGIVYGDPVTFTVDDFCAEFVEDDLWTYISGGVGYSKRWYIDLDENGVSKYFAGPVYFYGTDDSWETVTNGVSLDTDVYDSWYWQADWSSVAGWQWVDYAMDFGYMEFDLIDGSNLNVVLNDLGTSYTGKYMLDTDNHTITLTDAPLLHDSMNDSQVASWTGQMQLMSLTEDYMQIAVLRIEDPCYLVFNFISQDYYENYVEEVDENPAPELDDTWQTDISELYQDYNTYRNISWVLSEDGDACGYCDLYGAYESGAEAATDDALDMSLALNSGDMSYTMTDTDGNTVSGTYSFTDDEFIYFDNGLLELTVGSNGTVFKTNSDNTLRVLSYTMSDDELTDLWLGYDLNDVYGNRYKYQGFHFTPTIVGASTEESFKCGLHYFNTGWTFFDSSTIKITGDGSYTLLVEGSDSSPYGVYLDVIKVLQKYPNFDMVITDIRIDGSSIAFDDEQIERCTGDETDTDGNGITARRYIINPWNSENYFMANGTDVWAFSSSIEVDIDVTFDTGSPFIEE